MTDGAEGLRLGFETNHFPFPMWQAVEPYSLGGYLNYKLTSRVIYGDPKCNAIAGIYIEGGDAQPGGYLIGLSCRGEWFIASGTVVSEKPDSLTKLADGKVEMAGEATLEVIRFAGTLRLLINQSVVTDHECERLAGGFGFIGLPPMDSGRVTFDRINLAVPRPPR
jgi:hypothetical protein